MVTESAPQNRLTNGHANGLSEDVDIVIVGAGPTGILSALLARQLGLRTCVLDAKEGPVRVGGADAITARTQQYLEVASNGDKTAVKDAGILAELIQRGVKCNTSTTYADGQFTSRQSHWWNGIPHTFYNNLLMIGQPFIEKHLASHIDILINYSEPALSFSTNSPESGVTIKTAKRTVTAKYCIAADGARSFMRNQLGIGWEGTKPNMIWAVLDCWIDSTFPLGREIVTLQVDGESRMAWIPRERGMQRFYVLLDGEITQEKVEASIRKHMAPHPVEFTHIEWFSRFEIKECVATTFLHPTPQGPFILAGDAAHVHSVNGGQGMNTGLADAFNLIWRLNLLIKRPELPPSFRDAVLSSYDLERRATAKEVVDVASKLVRSTMVEAKTYVELIEKNSGFITGMGITYSKVGSPLVKTSEKSIFKAGDRCPDLWLQHSKSGESSRLYQQLIYGRYILLVVGKANAAKIHATDASVLATIPLTPLKPLNIGVQRPVANGESSDIEGEEVETFQNSYIKKDDSFAVLVRPDCYVEFVGELQEVADHLRERLPGALELK